MTAVAMVTPTNVCCFAVVLLSFIIGEVISDSNPQFYVSRKELKESLPVAKNSLRGRNYERVIALERHQTKSEDDTFRIPRQNFRAVDQMFIKRENRQRRDFEISRNRNGEQRIREKVDERRASSELRESRRLIRSVSNRREDERRINMNRERTEALEMSNRIRGSRIRDEIRDLKEIRTNDRRRTTDNQVMERSIREDKRLIRAAERFNSRAETRGMRMNERETRSNRNREILHREALEVGSNERNSRQLRSRDRITREARSDERRVAREVRSDRNLQRSSSPNIRNSVRLVRESREVKSDEILIPETRSREFVREGRRETRMERSSPASRERFSHEARESQGNEQRFIRESGRSRRDDIQRLTREVRQLRVAGREVSKRRYSNVNRATRKTELKREQTSTRRVEDERRQAKFIRENRESRNVGMYRDSRERQPSSLHQIQKKTKIINETVRKQLLEVCTGRNELDVSSLAQPKFFDLHCEAIEPSLERKCLSVNETEIVDTSNTVAPVMNLEENRSLKTFSEDYLDSDNFFQMFANDKYQPSEFYSFEATNMVQFGLKFLSPWSPESKTSVNSAQLDRVRLPESVKETTVGKRFPSVTSSVLTGFLGALLLTSHQRKSVF